MSRRRFGWVLWAAVSVTLVAIAPASADDKCRSTDLGIVCAIDGTIPGAGPPGDGTNPPDERPPIRYLVVDVDYTGADCYWWSRVPIAGAIDTWDPGNDPTTITTLLNYPACLAPPVVAAATPEDRAWEVYRSWTLQSPAPTFSPPASGITGLQTYLGATANPLNHRETLPSGLDLVVTAEVTAVTIDWGDGTTQRYSLTETRPYPDGTATHAYALKTCTAEYRDTDPSGHLCHPALEAYPITTRFTWTAGYQYDAGWIELESVDLSTTVAYDVDEVVGVPEG